MMIRDLLIYNVLFFITLFIPAHLLAQKTDAFNMDKNFSINEMATIHLTSDDAEVTITGSNRKELRVKVDYLLKVRGIGNSLTENFEMTVEERGDDIYIKEKPRDMNFNGLTISQTESYTILIEAPRTANLNLKGDDESYRISGFYGSIAIDADDASILMSKCRSSNFNIKMDDGEFKLDKGAGRLDFEMDDGNALIARAMFDEININMDDGTLEFGQARGELNLKADDGTVVIDDGDLRKIDLKVDDSKIQISNRYAGEGPYRYDVDDANVHLTFLERYGAKININHDHADLNIGDRFQLLREDDHHVNLQLYDGQAEVQIDTDDGDITLR